MKGLGEIGTKGRDVQRCGSQCVNSCSNVWLSTYRFSTLLPSPLVKSCVDGSGLVNFSDGWSSSNLQIEMTDLLASGSAASPSAREGDVLTSEIVWPFIQGTAPAGMEEGLRRQDG